MKNDKMILHISTDEKFINAAEYIFNQAFPENNSYLIIAQDKTKELKHVNSSIPRVRVINFKDYKIAAEQIKRFDIIVMHGMPYIACQLIINASSPKNFLWFFWGGEIYDNPKGLSKGIIGPLSEKKTFPIRLKKIVKMKVKRWHYKVNAKIPIDDIRIKAAKKINNFGGLHKEDFDNLVSSKILSESANFIPFTYYPIEFLFNGIEDCEITSDDILVGNSASYSNNHLEAFQIIRKFDISDKKIYTPLSYGDKKYADMIGKEGKKYFLEKFEPLLNFMPLKEYNLLLQKCGFVIMNHFRQQAVGNIITMLWLGAKVFLDERNTFYHYLKRLGVHVFSTDKDLLNATENPFIRLKQTQVLENKNLLFAELNTKTVVNRLRQGINYIK